MKTEETQFKSKIRTIIVALSLALPVFIIPTLVYPTLVYSEEAQVAPPMTAVTPRGSDDHPSGPASPCSDTPCEKVFHPPSFKVVFHNISGQTHILVPKKSSVKQLENLIYYFAEERKLNRFEKIGLPPNGGGDYLRGSILVFDEIKWARGEKLTNPKIKEKTYSRKVLAEYIWNNHSETAYIGSRNLFSHTLAR